MPNWIKGTMKLRGKRKELYRFFKEGLEASSWAGEVNKLEDQVKGGCEDGMLWFDFKDEPHIIGTRRAFIIDDCVEVHFDNDEEECVACVDVKQAWAFYAGNETKDLQNWKDISNKFNVDIRLYGVESGMCFTQEIIIVRGKRPIVNELQYEDWDWECPFPRMGG